MASVGHPSSQSTPTEGQPSLIATGAAKPVAQPCAHFAGVPKNSQHIQPSSPPTERRIPWSIMVPRLVTLTENLTEATRMGVFGY